MTTKQLSLALLCLLLLAGTGYSQMNNTVTYKDEAGKKSADPMYWGNVEMPIRGFFMEYSGDPAFRAALGISEEYYSKILTSMRDARESIPKSLEDRNAGIEYEDALEALTGNRYPMGQIIPPDADPKVLKRFDDAVKRIESISQKSFEEANRREAEAFDNALTPTLKQKLLEIPLATMVLGERLDFLPSAFAVLNLTDTQREQMERIKKELEPDFKRGLEIGADAHRIMFPKGFEAVQKASRVAEEARQRGEDGQVALLEAHNRFLMEDPEYQEALDKVYSSARTFAKQFTARVSEILDAEQRKRLQELTDNPPEYVRIHIQRLRENRGERTGTSEEGKSERVDGEKDVWLPGPDSWKPGDPLPEDSRRPRNERGDFPRPAE